MSANRQLYRELLVGGGRRGSANKKLQSQLRKHSVLGSGASIYLTPEEVVDMHRNREDIDPERHVSDVDLSQYAKLDVWDAVTGNIKARIPRGEDSDVSAMRLVAQRQAHADHARLMRISVLDRILKAGARTRSGGLRVVGDNRLSSASPSQVAQRGHATPR